MTVSQQHWNAAFEQGYDSAIEDVINYIEKYGDPGTENPGKWRLQDLLDFLDQSFRIRIDTYARRY